MRDILIVVDMQNDFIDGALGTGEALEIVPRVKEKIETFPGQVIFTRDTHGEDYMDTQEGKILPVPHCIRGSWGWQIRPELDALRSGEAVDKPTFGSERLGRLLVEMNREEPLGSITLVGLCTDICVISLIRLDLQCTSGKSISAGGSGNRGCGLLCGGDPGEPQDSPGGHEGVPGSGGK